MITHEAAWVRRVITDPLDDAKNHRRLKSALVGLLRLAEYHRCVVQADRERYAEWELLLRERREWKQLYMRATERVDEQQREHQLALDRHGSERFKAGATRGHAAGLRHGWEAFADAAHKKLAETGVAQIYDRITDLKARGPADAD